MVFFVLLLKILKNINVNKFSGYKFLNLFLYYLKKNKNKTIFCIDPNPKFSQSNKNLFKKLGIKKIYNYLAPKYEIRNFSDQKLLNKIKKISPDFILTNIGGGKQEILGLYLKKNLKIKNNYFMYWSCNFLFLLRIKLQSIAGLINLYLGWFVRMLFNPLIFLKRYLYSLRLIPMVIF